MTTTTYAGLDYGLGKTNIDIETCIRFGIISANALPEEIWEEFEPDYGEPTCPKCGNEALTWDKARATLDDNLYAWNHVKSECDDYACLSCKYIFGSESAFSEEPFAHTLDNGQYKAQIDSSGDLWVFKSPYFTYAQFCSPCAPGACYLSNPLAEPNEANKCYCLGEEFFSDDEPAPYPIYSVATGELVQPV